MFRWVDHTSEVELEIAAATRDDIFREAVAGLADLFAAGGHAEGEPAHEDVAVEAADDPALLAAFLEELVYLAETRGFVATNVVELDAGARRIRARIEGCHGKSQPLVKAVTYHRLSLEEGASGWAGRVVLDV